MEPVKYPAHLCRAAESGNPHAARLMARLYVRWAAEQAEMGRVASKREDPWAFSDAKEDAEFASRYAQRVGVMRRLNPDIPARWSRVAYAHAARAAASAKRALLIDGASIEHFCCNTHQQEKPMAMFRVVRVVTFVQTVRAEDLQDVAEMIDEGSLNWDPDMQVDIQECVETEINE